MPAWVPGFEYLVPGSDLGARFQIPGSNPILPICRRDSGALLSGSTLNGDDNSTPYRLTIHDNHPLALTLMTPTQDLIHLHCSRLATQLAYPRANSSRLPYPLLSKKVRYPSPGRVIGCTSGAPRCLSTRAVLPRSFFPFANYYYAYPFRIFTFRYDKVQYCYACSRIEWGGHTLLT